MASLRPIIAWDTAREQDIFRSEPIDLAPSSRYPELMRNFYTLLTVAFFIGTAPASEHSGSHNHAGSMKDHYSHIISPKDGETVGRSFQIKFGVKEGWKVVPADGKVIPKAGHHHLLIGKGPMAKGQVIPQDGSHLHFGKAQKEAMIKLPASVGPGKVKITSQFADGLHRSYGPMGSHTITVNVKK